MILRYATSRQNSDDCYYFFTLRIDPIASRMSRRRPPTWEEHMYWWEHTSDLRFIAQFVAQTDVQRVGTMRISADGVVSIIVDSAYRGKGLGPQMLEQVAPLAKAAGLTTLLAEVAPENVRSQRCFTRAGWAPILFEKAL